MKLPDFLMDSALTELRERIGAELRAYESRPATDTLTIAELEVLSREGLEIPLEDVQTERDGTLTYKGRRVILYIRDVHQYRRSDDGLPRFHVANCDKLEEMRSNNRYERYVVATRDTGMFQINLKRYNSKLFETGDHALRVCQFCLGRLNWEEFRALGNDRGRRKLAVDEFTLIRFFEFYPRSVISSEPKHDAHSAPLNDYTSDFRRIAENIKAARGYLCETCGIDLSKNRRFLHAHHKNGLKWDNAESNIRLLCVRHHALEFGHSHVAQLEQFKEFERLFPETP